MPDFHAERHDRVHVATEKAIFSRDYEHYKIFFVTLHPECCCAVVQPFILLSAYGNSAVLLMDIEALRFCLVRSNLENSKIEQDGVRRFTYIRGLVVS